MKVSASKLWNKSNHTIVLLSKNNQMHLPLCPQQFLIEPKKQLMRVMKYEGKRIKNMEWVEFYKN